MFVFTLNLIYICVFFLYYNSHLVLFIIALKHWTIIIIEKHVTLYAQYSMNVIGKQRIVIFLYDAQSLYTIFVLLLYSCCM